MRRLQILHQSALRGTEGVRRDHGRLGSGHRQPVDEIIHLLVAHAAVLGEVDVRFAVVAARIHVLACLRIHVFRRFRTGDNALPGFLPAVVLRVGQQAQRGGGSVGLLAARVAAHAVRVPDRLDLPQIAEPLGHIHALRCIDIQILVRPSLRGRQGLQLLLRGHFSFLVKRNRPLRRRRVRENSAWSRTRIVLVLVAAETGEGFARHQCRPAAHRLDDVAFFIQQLEVHRPGPCRNREIVAPPSGTRHRPCPARA